MKKLLSVFCLCACVMGVQAQSHGTYKEYVRRALEAISDDKTEDAEELFREAMKAEPAQRSNAMIYYQIGRIQEHRGKPRKALQSYTQGLNIAPHVLPLRMARARLYMEMGNQEKALVDYSDVLDWKEDEEEAVPSATEILEDRSEQAPVRKIQPVDPFTAPIKKKEPVKEEPSLLPEEDEREHFNQENELMLSVGIGGLQSNELGFAGISKRSKRRYTAPSADFLVDYPEISTDIDDITREQGDEIVNTLLQFHTEVSLDNIVKGPTVTMFELKLKEGTPVSRVRARYDELSYNLGGVQIRILAPVPGKQAVGIEVPNRKRAVIGFKDMLKAIRSSWAWSDTDIVFCVDSSWMEYAVPAVAEEAAVIAQ